MQIITISPFLEYYDRVRRRTLNLVAVIPPEKMDWAYKPGKFTIADVLRHIAAIERFMFAENVLHRPARYAGSGKELADGYDAVLAFFNEMHRQSMEIFATLNDSDLVKPCLTPAGSPLATWKWLRAMVEHEIHHRGELYIYLNLLNINTPPMYGLTAEELEEKCR